MTTQKILISCTIHFYQTYQQKTVWRIIDGQYQNDEFKVVDKSVYLYCPNGYGKTKLTNKFFEDKLKVTATTRNWKTIKELINMAEKI